jgi:mitogen-activated protein kinase kinase
VSLGGGGHTMSILDLLQHIVNEPAPRLTGRRRSFPKEAELFVEGCLDKDPGSRKSPQELLVSARDEGMALMALTPALLL